MMNTGSETQMGIIPPLFCIKCGLEHRLPILIMTAITEQAIQDCMTQIRQKQEPHHSLEIQKYAQLRLMDFAPLLGEWGIDDPKNTPKAKPLPNVAQAFQAAELSAEQKSKLLNYLQQAAKQGSTTAMLYLAYAYAVGKFIAQNPTKAVECARIALKHQDYRAARLLGEMLAFAPALASDVLQNDVQIAAQNWVKTHPKLAQNAEQIPQLITQYLHNPIVAKFVAKQKLQQAKTMGSPIADQRIRGLSMIGVLSSSQPARQYQSIENWLENQLAAAHMPIESDDDMMILPEHMPLMVQEDDDVPVWHKAAIVGGFLLSGAMITLLIIRFLVK